MIDQVVFSNQNQNLSVVAYESLKTKENANPKVIAVAYEKFFFFFLNTEFE